MSDFSQRSALGAVLVAAVALVAQGCDDPQPSAPDPYECVRLESLLDERRACVLDEDCPCGAHCALGLCHAECREDGPCGEGMRCDAFGRCRDGAGLALAVATAATGAVEVDQPAIDLFSTSSSRRLRLRARERGAGQVRVAGGPGVEVACAPGAGFAQDCVLEDLEVEDGWHEVEVRLAEEEADAGTRREVTIHAGTGRQSVGIAVRSPREMESRPSGLYRGVIWPVQAGLSSGSPIGELPEALAGAQIPVTVEVFPASSGEHVVTLADDAGGLFPVDPASGLAVGALAADESGAYLLAVETQRLLGPVEPGPDDLEVTARLASEGVTWEGEGLHALLRITYEGATLGEHAPFVLWQMSTTYVGDLEEDRVAPPPPAAYVPALDTSRAADPLAAERDPVDLTGESAARRASAVLCSPPADGPYYLEGAVLNDGAVDSALGDLACTDNRPQLAFGLVASPGAGLSETLFGCLEDLGFVEGSADGSCVDVAVVATSLGHGLEVDRARALGTGSAPDPEATAVAHRVLQQWVQLQGFLVREAQGVARYNDIAAEGSAAPPVAQDFLVAETLAASLAGWDLVLHPRTAVALAVVPPELLESPDYRARLFPDAFPASSPLSPLTHDQGVGLPVALLVTLADQVDALEGLILEVIEGQGDLEEVEPLLAELMRRAGPILGLAQGLHDAVRRRGEPSWEAEWDSAVVRNGRALQRLLGRLADLRQSRNPLGIEESDLPLYGIGDQEGARARFSAVTDYLLGTSTDETAVAPYMVGRAQQALDLARAAWSQTLERDFWGDWVAAGAEDRVDAIERHYGEPIVSLCNTAWDSREILHQIERGEVVVDPETCFVAEGCSYSDEDIRQRLTIADLGYELCFAHRLRQRHGPGASTGDATLDETIDAIGPALSAADVPFGARLVRSLPGFAVVQLIDDATEWNIPTESVRSLDFRTPAERGDTTTPGYVQDAADACESARQATLAARPTLPPPSCAGTDDCPVGYLCTAPEGGSGSCAPDQAADDLSPDCFSGALGEMAISLRATAREVDIARSEMAELTERYDIAMRSCMITQLGNEAQEQAIRQHNQVMDTLATAKLAADVAGHWAGAAKDAAGLDTVVSFGAKGGFTATEAAAKTVSSDLAFQMEQAERQHEEAMTRLENEIEEQICFNDAEMHLVGTRTAALRIQQATLELSRQLVELQNMKNSVAGYVAEGLASLADARDRRVSPMATDFWLDEHVEQYEHALRMARRAVYLAVLAAQYELQMTFDLREEVLAARTPQDLRRIVDDVRQQTLTGTIGGGRPEDTFAVVSLRRHLLQLADRSGFPEGWHAMTEVERFQHLLTSPDNAVYDDAGGYQGQQIVFTVTPLGATGLGEAQGVQLLTGNDCAERLWSVNASLLGEDLNVGGSTFAELELHHRNTFYSQWCLPPSEDEPFQVASTRPSRNLFYDPYGNRDGETGGEIPDALRAVPGPDPESAAEASAFSFARINAYLGITRAELEDEAYFNGDSEELAGRGLYGDYSITFPAQTLSIDGSDGLRLANVEDVLLRFDYVSVGRSRR